MVGAEGVRAIRATCPGRGDRRRRERDFARVWLFAVGFFVVEFDDVEFDDVEFVFVGFVVGFVDGFVMCR